MSRYVTSVGSTTVPLIEDTPDVIKQSVLGSVVGGTNIASDLVKTISNTYSHDVRRAYEYARTKYYYGLPEGSVGRFSVDRGAIREVLRKEIPLAIDEDITIVTASLNTFSYAMYTAEYLAKAWPNDFDVASNTLKDFPFDTYIDNSGDEVFTYDGYTGDAYIDGQIRNVTSNSYGVRVYTYEHRPDFTTKTWVRWLEVKLSNEAYNSIHFGNDQFYYYVEYFVFNKTTGVQQGANRLWNYHMNSNVFPTLTIKKDIAQSNYYMPIVPLRINNEMLTDEAYHHTSRYKTSKELLSILGLKIEELHEGILANPDVKEIDHAYVVLGANLFSDKPATIKYLHEFLLQLYGSYAGIPNSELVISDETYDMKYTWDILSVVTKYGSIGKVGTCTSEITSTTFYTRKQLTTDTYQECIWVEPVLHNRIYKTGKDVITSLDAYTEDNSEAFVIPLNTSIVLRYLTSIQANTLYYDSLKLVFNSYKRTKLKWYQTGIFKLVTIVIAVAVSLYTGGMGMAIVAAVAGVFMSQIINIAYKWLGSVFGDDIANYIMAVVVVVAIYYGYTNGFIADIGQVVNVAIQSSSMILEQIIGVQMEEITNNMAEFQEYAKEQMEHLEVVQSELNGKQQVDPLNIFGSIGMIPNQSIDQYYYSKLQLPLDYGTSAYDMLSHWVDSQLTLPHLTR